MKTEGGGEGANKDLFTQKMFSSLMEQCNLHIMDTQELHTHVAMS